MWDLECREGTGSSDGGPFGYSDPSRHSQWAPTSPNRCKRLENHCAKQAARMTTNSRRNRVNLQLLLWRNVVSLVCAYILMNSQNPVRSPVMGRGAAEGGGSGQASARMVSHQVWELGPQPLLPSSSPFTGPSSQLPSLTPKGQADHTPRKALKPVEP